ncbi:hypothetical protein Tsubulata_001569 [Turnera subulata]|uniref:Uncharacterized protein n=1 Tax=Turnera subulata TaxID=218843 RepID=A0A9Q0J363_9ROSI|nr:hypothetical protein Tsubulata_001569 [Turnera subulata]
MANSRMAKFIMDVAPPQYICVMRHRTSKMLDTIKEDDREVSASDSLTSPKLPTSSTGTTIGAATAAAAASNSSKYFFIGVQRSFQSSRKENS